MSLRGLLRDGPEVKNKAQAQTRSIKSLKWMRVRRTQRRTAIMASLGSLWTQARVPLIWRQWCQLWARGNPMLPPLLGVNPSFLPWPVVTDGTAADVLLLLPPPDLRTTMAAHNYWDVAPATGTTRPTRLRWPDSELGCWVHTAAPWAHPGCILATWAQLTTGAQLARSWPLDPGVIIGRSA